MNIEELQAALDVAEEAGILRNQGLSTLRDLSDDLLRRALEFIPQNKRIGQHEAGSGLAFYPPYKNDAERLRYEADRAAKRLERGEQLRQEIQAALEATP